MDLSNLRASLREEEASTRRRTSHLRAAEDELNGVFRTSALGLTTLYRQAVAASKASYEKGYAHALAHVLELCDNDRDWLKGYLQRRIEAIEAVEDESDDREPPPTQHQNAEEIHSSPAVARNHASTSQPRPTFEASPRHNKRTRGATSTSRTAAVDDEQHDRRISNRGASSSRTRPTTTSASTSAFSANFDFAAPIAYPDASAGRGESSASRTPRTTSRTETPSIKTSNPAAQRRRLHKLKGLRAGKDRVLEVHADRGPDDMDDGEEDEADWTDDDEEARGRRVGWADKEREDEAEARVVERLDRRKRRRTFNTTAAAGEEGMHA